MMLKEVLKLLGIARCIKRTGQPTPEPLLPSERVIVAKALEPWVRKKTLEQQTFNAQQRGSKGALFGPVGAMKAAGNPGYQEAWNSARLAYPPAQKRRRDWSRNGRSVLARLVGWRSPGTLHKASAIYLAGRKQGASTYGPLKAQMDKDGRVEAAYQTYRTKVGKQTKYRASALLVKLGKQKQTQIPAYVYDAMTYLPPDVQDKLFNEFDGYISGVSPADFNRAVKGYSNGAGLANMDTDKIQKALDDMFRYTRKLMTEWVLMPCMRTISNATYEVINAKGARVTLMDRLEWAVMWFAMSTSLLYGYLYQAQRAKLLDVPQEILEEMPAELERLRKLVDPRLAQAVGGDHDQQIIDNLVSAIARLNSLGIEDDSENKLAN